MFTAYTYSKASGAAYKLAYGYVCYKLVTRFMWLGVCDPLYYNQVYGQVDALRQGCCAS